MARVSGFQTTRPLSGCFLRKTVERASPLVPGLAGEFNG